MATHEKWREIVASSLDWDQAHTTLDDAVKDLTRAGRGKVPHGMEHSVWQLLEHIRIAQHDLLNFLANPDYVHDLKWPDDYWPRDAEPASDEVWDTNLAQLKIDRDALKEFTLTGAPDLTAKIPHGSGQTYLRTILLAVDHSAYHVGQIVDVRRLNGNWG